MYFSNFNIFWVCIFLLLFLIVIYFFYVNYKKQLIINNTFKKLAKFKYFYIKNIFLLLSLLIVLLSIFWIKYWNEKLSNSTYGIDIVFVLDVSKSMNVADIKDENSYITRLSFAKNAIKNYVVNNLNNRYWLVIFSGDAVSSVPLTTDKDIFLDVLDSVDYRNLLLWWSNFSKAMELWINRLLFSDDSSKALIFLSDWWEELDLDIKQLKKINNNKNIVYLFSWIWTQSWWKIIIWKDVYGRYSYQKYEGDYVISKLNEDNLKSISDIFDWKYIKFEQSSDINKFKNNLFEIENKIIETNFIWTKQDLSRYLSFISFIFFILFLFLYLFEDKIYFFNKKLWLKK